MVKTKLIMTLLALLAAGTLPAQEYSWSRYAMDGHRTGGDMALKGAAAKEAKLIEKYQPSMAFLKEVVGYSPEEMYSHRPQSPLSNWLADLMLEESERLTGEKCDVSLTNFGGIRVDMPKGEVTVDDIRSMLPFKNYVVYLKISGDSLWTVFDKMAQGRFEVLGGVKIRAGRKCLESVEIGGEPFDRSKVYTLITNSFLLDGGDGLFLRRSSQECRVLDQDFYEMAVDHLRRCMAEGRQVTGAVDDRIVLTHINKPRKKENQSDAGRNIVPVHSPAPAGHRLTILHTNDTHSHLETIRSGRYAGLGGVVERAAFVDSVRRADGRRNVLLLDAGDWDQGTSWFSVLKGRPEIEAMNIMKYDAATFGNHEWDNGIEDLADRIGKARFKILLCNYKVDDGRLNRLVKPYAIVRRGGMKIGLIGALVNVSSVVARPIADKLGYIRPDGPVNEWAAFLKEKKKCDLVIVLSHLGYSSTYDTMGDIQMAPMLRNVDIIVGGHSHTDLREAKYVNDADGKPVMIVQDQCWGIYVGEIKL